MRLLHVDASILGEHSVSRQLSAAVVIGAATAEVAPCGLNARTRRYDPHDGSRMAGGRFQ
ncbi:MAG TPA: hypothetical protein VJ738_15865 [Steroidobacteraceae bacterium]|nr:hypothetical protein [Steroidobacteraceae bacterium]